MRVPGRRIAALLVMLAMSCALLPVHAFATSAPRVSVRAAYLMTMDGHVLWSRHANTERRVASTIKMLNALVVREHASLDETVTVTAKAARTPDGVGLWKGEHLTVRQLLQMMLVPSGNDAAEALAIHIGGTEAKYVAMMNGKAKQMGLTRTHAVDPHGLSKKEHSTARDLAYLAKAVMADPVLRKIVAMRSVSVPRRHGKHVTVGSTDHLLGHYKGIEGVKTGFTNPAGYCFVGAAKRGKVELVSVVLGTRTLSARFSQTRKVLNWGFAGFKTKKLVSATATAAIVSVHGGVVPTDSIHPARDATVLVWTRGAAITTSMTLPAEIWAPIRRGDQLGVVRKKQGSWVLAAVPLLADSAVATAAPATLASALVPAPHPRSSAVAQAPFGWARMSWLWRSVLRFVQL